MRRGAAGDAEEDDRLIRAVVAGEPVAWRLLVERHLRAITGFAWYMLGDRAEAEDVAQEVFLRLLAKVAAWEPGGPGLRPWLHRVAINLCVDRARAPRPDPLEDQPEPVAEGEPGVGLDRQRLVRRALDALPERQRIAIVLVYYQDCSDREAALIMGVSTEALESLLARGRRSLRRRLDPLRADLLGAS